MTPQQKAKEIVDKYSNNPTEVFFTEDSIPRIVNAKMRLDSAKKCALIALDEILEDNRINYMLLGLGIGKYYWQEVKKEIEAL
jgi:hypothetical protein